MGILFIYELWIFTHITLTRQETHSAEQSFLCYKKITQRYSAAREFQGPQRRKPDLAEAQTGYKKSKQTKTNKREGNRFFREKKTFHGEDGHTEVWRSTLDNFCTVTGHTFAIQLRQQNHNSSVYHYCCQLFFITGLRSFNETQLQDS